MEQEEPTWIFRSRDPKGIYKRFDLGETNNVAGLDLKIDEPKNPDLIFEFPHSLTLSEQSTSIKIFEQGNLDD